ncbi:MAG: thiamine phosphate synthase, partial [Rhodospirillaceae bacterium]|nr:thiamine phosphate synthase [Rhodospirillaceae bacterium]
MSTLAKVSQRLNSGVAAKARVPQLILMTDDARLSDPARAMARLPRGSAVIIRTRDPHSLRNLTQRIKAQAKRRGILLLAATDVGHALRLGLDGAHLSERAARRGRRTVQTSRPGFIISASAHDRL